VGIGFGAIDSFIYANQGTAYPELNSVGIHNQQNYNSLLTGALSSLPLPKFNIISRIKESPKLIREAQKLTGIHQREINTLTQELMKGNLNPGIGSKSLGQGISYARSRNGARLFFRELNGKIEILGKSIKSNEQAVINEVLRVFGK
jgi:hypothetical protein